MDNRSRNIILCTFGFIFILIFIIVGIFMWNTKGYNILGIIYFSVLSLIEIGIIVYLIYNIYKKIKNNEQYAAFNTDSQIDPYSS